MTDQENSESNYTPAEEKAMARGWKPETDYEGEPDQWVDAGEFLRRGELMDTISSLNKRDKQREDKIDQLEGALKNLGEHNKKIALKEYEKAMAELKSQKARALDMEDSRKVVELDDQISDLKDSKKALDDSEDDAPTAKKGQNAPHPAFIAWVGDNPWYKSNSAMRGAADAIAREYVANNPDAKDNPSSVLRHVEAKVKEAFNMQSKQRPAATSEAGGEGKATATSKKASARNLTDDQRKVGTVFVKAGAFASLDEYAKQLAELGEI
jgi:vacuolar-type H+-ATPase subunit I/STV1